MALTKGEKRTAVLAVAIVFSVGVFWIASSVVNDINLKKQLTSFDDFKRQNAMTFQQGDTIRCNSEEDESLVDDAGWLFYAGFDWEGTMNLTVEDSWLFDNMADACAMIGEEPDKPESEEWTSFLFVKVRVENVDAVPADGASDFNISGMLQGPGEIYYFSGASEENGETGYFHYSLEPGESEVFYLGFGVAPDAPGAASEDFCLHAGAHRDEVEKITIACDPHDERLGERS